MIALGNKGEHPQKRAFLKAFAKCGVISKACKAAKCSDVAVWKWRQTDLDFQEQYQIAHDEFVGTLETEAIRRATQGVSEPIFNKEGEQIGEKIKYSDALLIFLLKGFDPGKYRDKFELHEDEEKLDAAIERAVARLVTKRQKALPGPA